MAGPALPSVTDIIIDPFDPSRGKGGHVEFEWKVEEATDGAKGGNVEFEWKVEEGESSGDVFDLTDGGAGGIPVSLPEYGLFLA